MVLGNSVRVRVCGSGDDRMGWAGLLNREM